MIRAIITSLFLYGLLCASAWADEVKLQENAPDRYVVVKGDTLWDISARFLKDPWRWPQVWKMNREQIHNPHLIYPGDVVVLDRSGPEPQLKLVRGDDSAALDTIRLSPSSRAKAIDGRAIPAIPPSAIAPFLGQPLAVEEAGLEKAPYVLATDDQRVVVGAGARIYAMGLAGRKESEWQLYQPGNRLIDPDTGEVLGREAIYLGDARVARPGEPATLDVIRSTQEIRKGDKLVPMAADFLYNFVPHAPDKAVNARVMSVSGGLQEAGQYAVVTVNRGGRDGMEVGHVLALVRHGAVVLTPDKKQVRLPDERYGLAFVFRVFDRLSYALLMNTSRPVHVGDDLRTP